MDRMLLAIGNCTSQTNATTTSQAYMRWWTEVVWTLFIMVSGNAGVFFIIGLAISGRGVDTSCRHPRIELIIWRFQYFAGLWPVHRLSVNNITLKLSLILLLFLSTEFHRCHQTVNFFSEFIGTVENQLISLKSKYASSEFWANNFFYPPRFSKLRPFALGISVGIPFIIFLFNRFERME